jgi:hypothetical protein
MYSFDHDIGSFVAIGTGTVSDDGQVIRSNPGVGVLKAGWHCGGDPAANGTVADCPECKICQGDQCVTDSSKNNKCCGQSNNKVCIDGQCTPLTVEVLSADVTQDKIQVRLGPTNTSGTLKLELRGPNTHTIREVNRNAGTFDETFDIPNLPNRTEFTSVRATWTVDSCSVTADLNYHIKVHGDVRHSVYNTPYESQCATGGTSNVQITRVVGNTCTYTPATLNSTFKSQLDINGSGISSAHGALQVEALAVCLNNAPAGFQGSLYRAVTNIRPACGGTINDGQVASFRASIGGDPLRCGARVFIHRLGTGLGTIKTVTDNCPACGPSPTFARQLDNYTTRQACNPRAFVDLGNFKTIEIF